MTLGKMLLLLQPQCLSVPTGAGGTYLHGPWRGLNGGDKQCTAQSLAQSQNSAVEGHEVMGHRQFLNIWG